MGKFITGLILGLFLGFIGILAIVYYAKGDWIDFKLIVLDISELIYKIIYAYFKYILFTIAVIIGLVVAYSLYEFVSIDKYQKEREAEIKEVENKAIEFIKEKKYEAENIINSAKIQANQIIQKAKEEAEYIRNTVFEKGYTEGQEKHKEELKSLRNKISAVRSIFKTYPELKNAKKNNRLGFWKVVEREINNAGFWQRIKLWRFKNFKITTLIIGN